ncbi:MAG: hypothetical protein DI570_02115 [Phenylobacterium zucineum]|nr:MAG: hypothetical protein DI570_02115 [Phenylobacterium zucineum]
MAGPARREVLGGLFISLASLAGITPALAQGAPLAWKPGALTQLQARTLDAYAELVFPATDTPGAREAGVPAFVDRAISTYCDAEDAERLRTALDRLDRDAVAAHGRPFADLAVAQQGAVLAKLEVELKGRTPLSPPTPFSSLKEYVTVGFFTSEPGATKTLQYDPIPGAFRGCVPLKEIGRAWAT